MSRRRARGGPDAVRARLSRSAAALRALRARGGSETTLQRGGPAWTEAQRAAFEADGFVLQPDVLSEEECAALRATYDGLFRGEFDTKIYPDEWHWREGISRPEAFREIVNAWKSSDAVARVALDETIGRRCAELMGWGGARLAQDDVLWKPPGAEGVAHHRDAPYISANFVPEERNSVTVWIALDDADEATGVVEYAPGSHAPADGGPPASPRRRSTTAGASRPCGPWRAAGVDEAVEVRRCVVPAGSAVFHHQGVWHGSGENGTPDRPRALGLHYVRDDVRFRPKPDYIYGRYDPATASSTRSSSVWSAAGAAAGGGQAAGDAR
ncbi:phytanoyl-CoA dioxygenase [Aureococcus anophagefferens]|nr:phytanoyl-CoA dioxygenase [Aureococcus anophagefferens]